MPNPPRTPAECFSTILLCLSLAVDAQNIGGRLPVPVIVLIMNRIRAISHRFARLAARLAAGTYVPRRSAAPRPHSTRQPGRRQPLPQGFAWLIKLVPEAAAYGSQLQFLLADPEMAALLAAAPAPMRRPLRSLCRMLGVAPPPILTPPVRPRPPRATPAETPKPPPQPSRPAMPLWLRPPPGTKFWVPTDVRRPPRPA